MSNYPKDIINLYKFLNLDLPKDSNGCGYDGIECSEDNNYITSLKLQSKEQELFLGFLIVDGKLDFNNFPLFEKLKYLEIQGNLLSNDKLPSIFFQLSNIEELVINGSELMYFPDKINSNCSIINIDLCINQFKTFPTAFKELPSLKKLIIARNRINGTIPKDLSEFPVLEELDLAYNSIEGQLAIPNSLLNLSIRKNSITFLYIKNSSIQLEKIDGENNEFTEEIFNDLKNCNNLKFLYLNKNYGIKEIPSSIQYLTSLEELYINNSDITNISDNFYNLTNLTTLSLKNNTKLNVEIKSFPTKIEDCNFHNTPIKCIQPNTCKNFYPESIKTCSNKNENTNSNFSFEWIAALIVFTILTTIGFLYIKKKGLFKNGLHHDNDIIITEINKSTSREGIKQNNSCYSSSNSTNLDGQSHSLTPTTPSSIQPLLHNYSISSNISPSSSRDEVPTLTFLASLSDSNENDILPSYIDAIQNSNDVINIPNNNNSKN